MSNRRRLPPRPPDEIEAAFAAELLAGCPYCRSRKVSGRFHDGRWDYRLSCVPSCRTFTEPQLAHRVASEAAERAGLATGRKLSYRAIDSGSRTTGVVLGSVA